MSNDEKATQETAATAEQVEAQEPKKKGKTSKAASAKSQTKKGAKNAAADTGAEQTQQGSEGGSSNDEASEPQNPTAEESSSEEEELTDEQKEVKASSNKEFKISQILIKEFASFCKIEVYSKDLKNVYRRYKVHLIFNDKKFQQRFDRLNEQNEELTRNPELPLGSKKFETRQKQIDNQWQGVTKELDEARTKYPSISFDVVTDGMDFTSAGVKFDWEIDRKTIEFLMSRGLGECNKNYILTLRAEK